MLPWILLSPSLLEALKLRPKFKETFKPERYVEATLTHLPIGPPLVQRMKQGPASIFMELGENSGDALFELSQTDIDFNAMMRYSFLKLEEWFEKAGWASSSLVGGIRRGTI